MKQRNNFLENLKRKRENAAKRPEKPIESMSQQELEDEIEYLRREAVRAGREAQDSRLWLFPKRRRAPWK